MTTLTSETRTARKTHLCDVCGRRILNGERYHYQFVVGSIPESGEWRWCEHCLWVGGYLMDALDLSDDEGIDVGGELHELAHDAMAAGSLTEARLYAWFRRTWFRADGTPVPLDEMKALAGVVPG